MNCLTAFKIHSKSTIHTEKFFMMTEKIFSTLAKGMINLSYAIRPKNPPYLSGKMIEAVNFVSLEYAKEKGDWR